MNNQASQNSGYASADVSQSIHDNLCPNPFVGEYINQTLRTGILTIGGDDVSIFAYRKTLNIMKNVTLLFQTLLHPFRYAYRLTNA